VFNLKSKGIRRMKMKYGINENGRDFVVGDLHGCMELLQGKLREVEFDFLADRLFSVGDLIDRGPDSMDCLYLINSDWFYPVQGNHEDMMLKVILDGSACSHWVQNGGGWFLREDNDELKYLCEKVRELPYSITVETRNGDVGICHSQAPSHDWADTEAPTERDVQVMLWARETVYQPNSEAIEGVSKTYHGHTILDEPLTIANMNFIDTGAFHTGNLTMVQINP